MQSFNPKEKVIESYVSYLKSTQNYSGMSIEKFIFTAVSKQFEDMAENEFKVCAPTTISHYKTAVNKYLKYLFEKGN